MAMYVEDTMQQHLKLLALSIGLLASLVGAVQSSRAGELSPVTAIDILIEPNSTMITHAQTANARLLKAFPKGFALDASHRPHISCLQRYVKTADLDKVYEAVGKVLAEEKPTSWKLKAYKYYYIPWKDVGLAGIVIEPTADLLRYQTEADRRRCPIHREDGDCCSLRHDGGGPRDQPANNQLRRRHLCRMKPAKDLIRTSRSASPPEEYLKRLLDEKFEAFTFSPAGVSVYQLGNFGTARTKLKGWDLGD